LKLTLLLRSLLFPTLSIAFTLITYSLSFLLNTGEKSLAQLELTSQADTISKNVSCTAISYSNPLNQDLSSIAQVVFTTNQYTFCPLVGEIMVGVSGGVRSIFRSLEDNK